MFGQIFFIISWSADPPLCPENGNIIFVPPPPQNLPMFFISHLHVTANKYRFNLKQENKPEIILFSQVFNIFE